MQNWKIWTLASDESIAAMGSSQDVISRMAQCFTYDFVPHSNLDENRGLMSPPPGFEGGAREDVSAPTSSMSNADVGSSEKGTS